MPASTKTKQKTLQKYLGKTFHHLEVIGDCITDDKILCKCLLCGTEKNIGTWSLYHGKTKSCGCLSEQQKGKKRKYISPAQQALKELFEEQKQFGYWTVIGFEVIKKRIECRSLCAH